MKLLFILLTITSPLFAQLPEAADVAAVPLDGARLINMSELGWYQLEGDWSFEEIDGVLVGYATGQGDHYLLLADADGKPDQRMQIPSGFAVRERGERLVIMDRLTTVTTGVAVSIDDVNGGTMSGCWNPLAPGHYDCSGNGTNCVYEYTNAEGNCVRLEDTCGNGGYIRITPGSDEVETNIDPARCKNVVPIEIFPLDRN